MIEIEKTVVSRKLLENRFVCDLNACKGACCVEGDSGAPVEESEKMELQNSWPMVKGYLPKSNQEYIEKVGFWEKDSWDGQPVTPLINGKECAYVFFDEKGLAVCSVEKAFLDGKTKFRKPISCHLYPVRLKEYKEFTSVNIHEWSVCNKACVLGEKLNVPVFRFLKEALIRKFGEKWFEALEDVFAKYFQKSD